MENTSRNETSQWVQDCAASLAPPADWEPDAARAHARFESRLIQQHAAWRWFGLAGAAATALASAVLLVSPGARAFAQQIWNRMTVHRFEVVRIDLDNLPDEARSLGLRYAQEPKALTPVADANEAARQTGFTPRLPHTTALSGATKFGVYGITTYATTLKLADLQVALKKAGVMDEAPPASWDGAQLSLQLQSVISAGWPGDVELVQALPPVFSTPSGFDLGAFARMLLRAAGLDRANAQRLGDMMRTSPAMMLGIGGPENVTIREVRLRAGTGTLIEDAGQPGRVALLWNEPDRVYILNGPFSAAVAIEIANSVQ